MGQIGGTLLPCAPGELQYGLKDQVLTCPWHHWEFDLETGRALFDERMRVKVYPVESHNGDLCISMGREARSGGEAAND
jgi:nitrite reductase/ring-hydroxylating ferredoxin subunit